MPGAADGQASLLGGWCPDCGGGGAAAESNRISSGFSSGSSFSVPNISAALWSASRSASKFSLTNASTDNTTVAGGGDGSDRAEEGKKKPPHPHHMPSLQEVNAELNWEENDGIMHSGDTPRGPASGIDYDAVLRQQGGLMTRQQISHLPPRGEKQNSGGNNVHFEL